VNIPDIVWIILAGFTLAVTVGSVWGDR